MSIKAQNTDVINVIRNIQLLKAGINISNHFMNKRNILAHYVIIKQHNRVVLPHTATSSSLNRHIQSEHKGKKYQCDSCDKEFTNSSTLWAHYRSVHEGVTYECNICQSTFTQKGSLSQHIKSVHFKETCQCELCDYQAPYKHSLSTHVKNVHQKSENIKCSECNKSMQKRSLKIHMKKFHSGEQTLYNCNVCTYQSLHQGALSTHVTNVHQKSK